MGYLIHLARKVRIQGRAMLKRFSTAAVLAAALVAGGAVAATPAGASAMPNGQRMTGDTTFDAATGHFVGGGGTIEPAYNDANGTLIYLQTPNNAPANPASGPSAGPPADVAPIYIVVYPAGSGIDPASLNCSHVPADNCPDHGPAIAGAAAQIMPAVYGGGVIGHDHLAGIASAGGDFNVLWEPVLVLFTNPAAATEHITTLAQINTDLKSHNVTEVGLPTLDFYCAPVSAADYAQATPAPTVS